MLNVPLRNVNSVTQEGNIRKRDAGIINNYTGISAPYEEPVNPNLEIDTEKLTLEGSVKLVLDYLNNIKFI